MLEQTAGLLYSKVLDIIATNDTPSFSHIMSRVKNLLKQHMHSYDMDKFAKSLRDSYENLSNRIDELYKERAKAKEGTVAYKMLSKSIGDLHVTSTVIGVIMVSAESLVREGEESGR